MDSLVTVASDFGMHPISGNGVEGEVFRPIQYLGSKLRVIDEIIQVTRTLAAPGDKVADLFSGSSVVSQAFALNNYRVTATDTQHYAVSMAKACLGVGFDSGQASCLLRGSNSWLLKSFDIGNGWHKFSLMERSLIENVDAEGLRKLYANLPLLWKSSTAPHYNSVTMGFGESAFWKAPLITSIYAGSYFGVQQALEIDQIRHTIEDLHLAREIDDWSREASLTALFHASSRAVHSAGKHFAQPMNASRSEASYFNDRRLIEDRSISIQQCFMSALARIVTQAGRMPNVHTAFVAEAENIPIGKLNGLRIAYLDPPYTAQQYSRFYHVLETIENYIFPHLLNGRKITQGLYPRDRYKSAFSSKKRAGVSMNKLLTKLNANGICAVISYSRSENGSNGNDRMISFDALYELCTGIYQSSNVKIVEMGHSYRQFNSSTLANAKRNDPELLIVCSTD